MKKIDLASVHAVLWDFYDTRLPEDFLLKVVQRDPEVIKSIEEGCIRDTWDREVLIHWITKELGLPEWPINADSPEYTKNFFRAYVEAVERVGGSINPVD